MTNDLNILTYNEITYKKDSFIFGLSIKLDRENKRITHVGLTFNDDNEIVICHFCENGIKINNIKPEYMLIQMHLNRDDVITIAGFFKSIKEANDNILFSYAIDSSRFNGQGKFLPQKRDSGITCCSFIYLGFECAGYPVVKKETWKPRDEDKNIEQDYMEFYSTLSSEEYKKKLPYPRIRPEEIAFACGTYKYVPLTFTQVLNNVSVLTKKIDHILKNERK